MTPAQFLTRYGGLAKAAGAATSTHEYTILAQWAVETGWGTSPLCVDDHNLAGIRWYGRPDQERQIGGTPGKVGTGFGAYASLAAFDRDYAHTLNLSYYDKVRAATTVDAELRALGASPWDAGHYLLHGVVGGSVLDAWHRLPVPATTWSIHLAPHAEIRSYRLGPGGCVAGVADDDRWGPTASAAPCQAPISRHDCPPNTGNRETVHVTAGTFRGHTIRVSAAHGVSIVRHET